MAEAIIFDYGDPFPDIAAPMMKSINHGVGAMAFGFRGDGKNY